MKSDDALRAYTCNRKFSSDKDINRELQKYDEQLMLDDNDIIYYRDSADNT